MRRPSRRYRTAALLETLESRVLLDGVLGAVDAGTSSAVTGWAYDVDLGSSPVQVRAVIGATPVAEATANVTRPDLAAGLGSADHGYSLTLNAGDLSPGGNLVIVQVQDSPGAEWVTIGSVGVYRPFGYVDVATATTVSGWAVDFDVDAAPVEVQVFVDGVLNQTVTANQSRPDLIPGLGSEFFGYTATLTGVTIGLHRIDVFAKDTQNGDLVLIDSRQINDNSSPIGVVDVVDATSISGWAFDADAGSAPIFVLYQIDNFVPQTVQASGNRPDLTGVIGSPLHGFNITLPELTTGLHNVQVWALDPISLEKVSLVSTQINVAAGGDSRPIGALDVVNGSTLTGWAWDADAGSSAIQVRVDVDGVTLNTYTADATRSDLTPFLGSSDHGFSIAVGPYAAGARVIEVFAINPETSDAILIGSKVRRDGTVWTDTTALGSVDILTSEQIAGWAYSPSSPTAATFYRIDVDGMIGVVDATSVSRPDVAPLTDGYATTGFSVTPTFIAAGSRHVVISVIDPITYEAFVLIDTNVTFS